jgi:thioredoxin 1
MLRTLVCSCCDQYGFLHAVVAFGAILVTWRVVRWIVRKETKRSMSKTAVIGIVIALVVVVGAAIAFKEFRSSPTTSVDSARTPSPAPSSQRVLPRLVDVGAGKCIPCKMMAPILEELRNEYAAKLQVDFIDVWENPGAGEPYRIRVIPTQIFYDPAGKELFRHEGYFSKQDILAKWKEFGIVLEASR